MPSTEPPPAEGAPPPRFTTTLSRVLAVQVVTLALLWLLQSLYHR